MLCWVGYLCWFGFKVRLGVVSLGSAWVYLIELGAWLRVSLAVRCVVCLVIFVFVCFVVIVLVCLFVLVFVRLLDVFVAYDLFSLRCCGIY